MPLDPRITSALNERLASPLRVEVDEVVKAAETGQVNLTSLARHIQNTLDALQSASGADRAQLKISEDGILRIVWHARARRHGEKAKPVIA